MSNLRKENMKYVFIFTIVFFDTKRDILRDY